MKIIISLVVIMLFPFLTCFAQVQLSSVTIQTATYDSISGDVNNFWRIGDDELEEKVENEKYHTMYDLNESKKQVVVSFRDQDGTLMERVFEYDIWNYDEEAKIYTMGSDDGGMLEIDLNEKSILQTTENEVFKDYIVKISQKNETHGQVEIKSIHFETGIYDEVNKEFYKDWSLDMTQVETIVKEDSASDFFYLNPDKKEVKAVLKLENGEWNEIIFAFKEWDYNEEEKAFYLASTEAGVMRIDLNKSAIIQIIDGEYFKYFITDYNVK